MQENIGYNIDSMELHDYLLDDLKRFGSKRTSSLLKGSYRILTSASYKMTFWFRIGTYCGQSRNLLLRNILYPVIRLYYTHISYLTGIQLPLGTKVGGYNVLSFFRNYYK